MRKKKSCLSVSQRYILKANHNSCCLFVIYLKLFISKSKIHFESKSQLTIDQILRRFSCLSVSQRYILKANHNSTQPVNYFIGGSPYYSSSEPDGKTHNTPKCG